LSMSLAARKQHYVRPVGVKTSLLGSVGEKSW
jgi:hypothetical protein